MHHLENLRGIVGVSDMDALRVLAPKQSVGKMLNKSLSAHSLIQATCVGCKQ